MSEVGEAPPQETLKDRIDGTWDRRYSFYHLSPDSRLAFLPGRKEAKDREAAVYASQRAARKIWTLKSTLPEESRDRRIIELAGDYGKETWGLLGSPSMIIASGKPMAEDLVSRGFYTDSGKALHDLIDPHLAELSLIGTRQLPENSLKRRIAIGKRRAELVEASRNHDSRVQAWLKEKMKKRVR
ncbi:MAG: hypothetical protein ABIB61_03710 [Candidatus Shapirobacteria bacterium]